MNYIYNAMCCPNFIHSPDALNTSIGVGALFSSSVRLFWPCGDLLEEEERTLLEKERKGVLSFKSVFKNMFTSHKIDKRWEENSWWLAKRNDYYVGVCCTGKTVTRAGRTGKDALIELKRGSSKLRLVVSKYQSILCYPYYSNTKYYRYIYNLIILCYMLSPYRYILNVNLSPGVIILYRIVRVLLIDTLGYV